MRVAGVNDDSGQEDRDRLRWAGWAVSADWRRGFLRAVPHEGDYPPARLGTGHEQLPDGPDGLQRARYSASHEPAYHGGQSAGRAAARDRDRRSREDLARGETGL